MAERRTITLGTRPLTIEDVIAIADGNADARIDDSARHTTHIEAGVAVMHAALERGQPIYGVTTGFGDSVSVPVQGDAVAQLPLHLLRFHGCGTGALLDARQSRAIVVTRLASLSRGYSAVRPAVLHALCDLLRHGVSPCIPAEGSVGASGDLTPLSYVAACLVGEREVWLDGQVTDAASALARVGMTPLSLQPKESLAIMNGTSVMTGLAALAHHAAARLSRLATALTAMTVDVVHGVPAHFDARVFELKAHPGSVTSAAWLRDDLQYPGVSRPSARLQDRYSLRCAPHVIGVSLDALRFHRGLIETEINGVNDNPIVDVESERVLFGGNFYGGHIAFAMDGLKQAIANLADLLERQLVLLCHPSTSDGLPANLVGAREQSAHFGFKAMQISASALTAEALKLTLPASVFSRSTENHNQDKVSMGTIAARDCLRVIELTETVAAIHLLALCQAVDLRQRQGCHQRALALHEAVRTRVPMHSEDRRMDVDIADVLARYRADALPIGAWEAT